jgi:hypothetical protein
MFDVEQRTGVPRSKDESTGLDGLCAPPRLDRWIDRSPKMKTSFVEVSSENRCALRMSVSIRLFSLYTPFIIIIVVVADVVPAVAAVL